ncbi:hypothetical protein QJQ45_004702 [Haematococcus lacustris]|nr:hypothetical protein QJQ45_004702 [Haematococcus lacustris]
MYYRLLSMRVLVDWDTKKVWQGLFFYYFIATWILLNIWCVHGIVNFRDQGIDSPADTVQFSTFVVVNLQTMQLVLLIRGQAENAVEVEAAVAALREQMKAGGDDAAVLDVAPGKEDHCAVDTSTCGLDAAPSTPLAPDTPTATAPDAAAFTPTPPGLATMSAPTVAPSGQRVLEQPITAGAVAVKLPLATVLSSVASGSVAETWQEKEARLHQGWWGSMTLAVQKSVYSRLYGTLHGVRCAVLCKEHTWPFRGDIAYFRMLCVLELIGLCSVAGVVVFGLLRATDSAR